MAKASVELPGGMEQTNLAENISQMFSSWKNGKQEWENRVEELTSYLYATSTRETTNVKNPWSHSTHIPKLTQIHDNLAANYSHALFNKREFFEFFGGDEESVDNEKVTAVNNYLMSKHDFSGFFEEMKKCLMDWVRTGNCFLRLEYVRETVTDQVTDEEIVTYEGPKPYRISPYDIVFDYTANTFEESPKILRTVMTRGELMRKMEEQIGTEYDEEEVKRAIDFYGIVGQWTIDDINKQIQFRHDGFNNYGEFFQSGKVEVLDFVGDIYDEYEQELYKDQIITVLDRRFVIRKRKIDDYHGFGKIYHIPWRKRPENLWGMGPLDNLVGMQYLINHLENARADGFDQMLAPDRVFVGQVEVEHDGPITNYWIDDGNGSVNNLPPDRAVLHADTEIEKKEYQMEAYAGAPRQAMGIRTPGEKTAFEVQQLENAATRLFQNKIEDFEIDFINPVLQGELEIAVKNMLSYDVIKTLDDDIGAVEFMEITKEDITARGKLVAQGSSHFAKRNQTVQELSQFTQILASDPEMKMHYPAKHRAKLWAQTLDFEDADLYKPFGAIEEQLEAKEVKQAAAKESDEIQAAGMTDDEAQDRAAGIAGQLAQQDSPPTNPQQGSAGQG